MMVYDVLPRLCAARYDGKLSELSIGEERTEQRTEHENNISCAERSGPGRGVRLGAAVFVVRLLPRNPLRIPWIRFKSQDIHPI